MDYRDKTESDEFRPLDMVSEEMEITMCIVLLFVQTERLDGKEKKKRKWVESAILSYLDEKRKWEKKKEK